LGFDPAFFSVHAGPAFERSASWFGGSIKEQALLRAAFTAFC
jgi:hypothetical protein